MINCAYGSSKDVSVYKDLGLQKDQIYIVSKKSSHSKSNTKKLSATDYQVIVIHGLLKMSCQLLSLFTHRRLLEDIHLTCRSYVLFHHAWPPLI